jgi:hypothetical protein
MKISCRRTYRGGTPAARLRGVARLCAVASTSKAAPFSSYLLLKNSITIGITPRPMPTALIAMVMVHPIFFHFRPNTRSLRLTDVGVSGAEKGQ